MSEERRPAVVGASVRGMHSVAFGDGRDELAGVAAVAHAARLHRAAAPSSAAPLALDSSSRRRRCAGANRRTSPATTPRVRKPAPPVHAASACGLAGVEAAAAAAPLLFAENPERPGAPRLGRPRVDRYAFLHAARELPVVRQPVRGSARLHRLRTR